MNPAADTFGYTGDGTAQDVIRWALERYHPRIAIACSFQHLVVVHMAVQIRPDVRVFSIDTGRLPEETYTCASEAERAFGIQIEWVFPQHQQVEHMMRQKGPFSFRESVANRRECCGIRKVEPMQRALAGMDAWCSGIRRAQNAHRAQHGLIERDTARGDLVKINPLANWTDDDIRAYVKQHRLPYNRLFEKGYTSIGCACCTRAIQPGDDPRAGRWWWEFDGHKECGIHIPNWDI